MTFTSAFGVPAGSNPCFNGSPVSGAVMSVGARFVPVEEIAAAGYLTTSDYDVLSEYFAAPAVDDANASLPDEVQFAIWARVRIIVVRTR